ncbi:MAG: autotransporter-associated beta strand repeat-containing protein, partial [Verrucomicrobia bacterium]|nr:autotransporter-associated beta strand repeat-containing protein [Verrucomicrobiota bacterium]
MATLHAGMSSAKPAEGITSAIPYSGVTPQGLTVPNCGPSGPGDRSAGREVDRGRSVTKPAGDMIQGTAGAGLTTRPNEAPAEGSASSTVAGDSGEITGDADGSATSRDGRGIRVENAAATLDKTGRISCDVTPSESGSQAVTGTVSGAGSAVRPRSGGTVGQGVAGGVAADSVGITLTGVVTVTVGTSLGSGPVTVSGNTSNVQVESGVSPANTWVLQQGATLSNAGNLTEVSSANGGGTLTNQSTGTISGAMGTPAVDLVAGTVNNAGQIGSAGAPAGITSAVPFSGVTSEALTVQNSGSIIGGTAIDLVAGGSITNNAGGSITSINGPAIVVTGGAATLSNAGQITGNVTLDNYSANQVTLIAGGTISGNLSLGTAPASALILDGSGSQALSQAVTGTITNYGSVIKQGSGTWVIDESLGAYAGGTFLNGGILAVVSVADLGTGPLSFNGGTLEALAAGGGLTLIEAVTLGTGGGTFLTDAGTVSTLSGAITGSGGLTKTGLGTLVLAGANTYTGGTFLNAGILAVNTDANLGAGPLTFNGGTLEALAGGGGLTSTKAITLAAGGGTFLTDAGTVSTLTGVIAGPGGLTKAGPGTLVLTGDNTYTGNTTVSAGTLQLGNGGTTGSVIGDIFDAGLLVFDRSDVFTYGGLISGPGSVAQVGTGTTILTADNTYTGGTTIAPGSTLQLGNGGSTGSVVGNIVDDGTLIVDRSNALSLTGAISGTGDLEQNGPGTTTLTGVDTYTGATTVNAGSLIVDGSIASALTTVNPGGVLGGSGFIGGSVVNGGIVSAGSPVGTLTVAGNYTQTPTGTLRLSLAPGATSLLAVGGTASLAGALQLVPLAGFQFRIGTTLTVLTAAGGVTGTFSTLNPFVAGTIVEGTLVYLTGSVALEAVQGSFTTVATTPNQLAVAHALDAAARDPRAAALIGFLDTQPLNLLARDLDLISPDELTAFNSLGVALTGVQVANVER